MMNPAELDIKINKIQQQRDNLASESLISEICKSSSDASQSTDLYIACLLRLLAIDWNLIYRSNYRREALNLILERLQQAEFWRKNYDLNKKLQADEVCRILSGIENDANTRLKGALDSYLDINHLEDFRKNLLSTLNHPLSKAVIEPFLCFGEDTTQVLRKCLGASIEYAQMVPGQIGYDAGQVRIAYDEAHRWLDNTITSDACTVVRDLIAEKLQVIRDDLESDFWNSPFGKPAKLGLRADLRLHPLRESGLDLLIPVELYNKGEGPAIDVEVRLEDAIGLKEYGPPLRISSMDPGYMIIEVKATTDPDQLGKNDPAICDFILSWVNTDGEDKEETLNLEIQPQDSSVNWDKMRRSDPYSLEAVTKQDELVGRQQMLDRIIATLNTDAVGSL